VRSCGPVLGAKATPTERKWLHSDTECQPVFLHSLGRLWGRACTTPSRLPFRLRPTPLETMSWAKQKQVLENGTIRSPLHCQTYILRDVLCLHILLAWQRHRSWCSHGKPAGLLHHSCCHPPSSLNIYPHKVSAGDRHTCGIKVDQTISCWGHMRFSPPGLFQQLSVGGHHTCGLRREGTAVCWGDDLAGSTSGVPKDTLFVQVLSRNIQSNVGIGACQFRLQNREK